MNLAVGSPTWLAVLVLLTLAAAAIEDALRLRISNITCLAVFVEGMTAIYLHGFSPDLWQNLVAVICVFAIGTIAFSAGLFGGGDVKLLAALALWVDLKGLIWLIAVTFIAGGVLALLYIAARIARSTMGKASPKDRRIPYGIAIAVGALFLFATQRSEKPRPLPAIHIVKPVR